MYAARYNQNTDVLTTLLAAGADIKAQDTYYGATALIWAARFNRPEVITTLLKAGADFEARANDGSTALITAVEFNENSEVFMTLLKAGEDAKAKDKAGKTAFDYAQSNEKLKGTTAYQQLQQASQ